MIFLLTLNLIELLSQSFLEVNNNGKSIMPDSTSGTKENEKLDITIPPADVRVLIGKTAIYVNKNGVVFENKIRTKESKNPKFIFLNDNDPYNEYYQYCLSCLKTNGKLPEIKQDIDTSTEDAEIPNVETIQATDQEILEKPEEYDFIKLENDKESFPEDSISSNDLNVIKLAAQFAVVNGNAAMEEFKTYALDDSNGISAQFQFLKLKHSMYPIYEKFYKQYDLLWNNKNKIQEKINNIEVDENSHIDKLKFLERCNKKAEYLNKQRKEVKEVENKKLAERIKYHSIDWLKFELVETIEFTQLDEIAQLHKPLNKSDLEYRSLVQKGQKSLFDEVDARIEEDYQSDDNNIEEDVEGENDDEGIPQYVEDDKNDSHDSDDEKEVNLINKRVPKGVKIKAAGESRLKRRREQDSSKGSKVDPITKEKLLQCPITKELIPESKFQNHINKLLRDPKYEEEKARYESKFKYGTNLSTEQVYRNLQDLFTPDENNNKSKRSKV